MSKKKVQIPFTIEEWKNGANVETRGGKSVRIVCTDGRTYITKAGYKEYIDITEHEIAQRYAPNDVAKMDKINILEAAGFKVVDTREYGYGCILKIYL